MDQQRIIKTILGLWLGGTLLLPIALASGDYTYRDEDGNTIKIPTGLPTYTETTPGPWKDQIQAHMPSLKTKTRKAGLELIRIISFEIPHPAKDKNTVKAIFVSDKDGLVIGYKAFSPKENPLKAEFSINGVINYVEVYVQCSEHEIWKKTFRI